ncbi:hypothetical protein EKK58_01075 [Candidatus Dependentiae bacterium]|nr:MAG: hypothetical protein EKK58_01075 [Candidatus Dependentiae bacterium]
MHTPQGSAAVLDIGTLHQDGEPIPQVEITQPVASRVTVGRIRRHQAPNTIVQPAAGAPAINEYDAKRMILNGLGETLRGISQLPEADRVDRLNALIAGSSLTGFVKTNRGQRVDSVDGLRSLISALHTMTTAKTFDGGRRHLFFFAVPRGWLAYAGDVRVDPLVRFYQKKDRRAFAARAEWEKARDAAIAAGTEVPPEVQPHKEIPVSPTGSSWGTWVNLLRASTEVDFLEMPVITPKGVKREFRPVLINRKAPLHRARTLTFVVDAESKQLLAWQAGRYVADMTPAQRMDRVILASGDVTDEEI